jgi:hypothetical protein
MTLGTLVRPLATRLMANHLALLGIRNTMRVALATAFCGERGSVLFIESSGCLHLGGRQSVKPRVQLMLGYTGACRADFSDDVVPPRVYPVRPTDSRLRRMVLDRNMAA